MASTAKRIKAAARAAIARHPELNRRFRLAYYRHFRAPRQGYPDWNRILGPDKALWEKAVADASDGPRILLATSVGAYLAGNTIESLLGVALTLRGARVDYFLCDETLPACFDSQIGWFPNPARFAKFGPQKDLCSSCFSPADNRLTDLGFTVHRFSDFLTEEDRRSAESLSASLPPEQLSSHAHAGISVGEHALAGALRFFARADLNGEPSGEAILRRYFAASLLAASATRGLLEKHDYSCAVFNHGIYVPQGPIGDVARQKNVRVVNWNPAYRKKCFIFSEGGTYHHTLMTEPSAVWENLELDAGQETELDAYLQSRWKGTEDWIWFHEDPQFDLADIAGKTGVDFSQPCVGLLTNVMWDAQLHYPANAFPDMKSWLLKTIDYFAKRPDLQLLIRVHPAEIRGTLPSRQPVVDEIRRAFPVPPKNVFVIPPESKVSTYAAMRACNAVLIYGTKTGVELAPLGVPVVVAGEAWVRNKGITIDASTEAEYIKVLEQLPFHGPTDENIQRRARKYAYHFFSRRMIPLEFMETNEGDPPYRINASGLNSFRPGASRGLDVICDGILNGKGFVFPAESFVKTGVSPGAAS